MATVRMIFVIILLYSNGKSVLGRNGTMDDWIRLTNTLFSNYTKDIYPVYNLSDILTVQTQLFFLSIVDFDEVSSFITMNGGLMLSWVDFRLAWNPSDYGGITDILVNSSCIWTPKMYLITTAEDMESFDSNQFDTRVDYTGTCYLTPGNQMRATCSVDMSRFPLDSHKCDLIFSQWGMRSDEVKIINVSTSCMMDYYTPNGEWNITRTSVSPSAGLPNGITFSVELSRKPIYFTLSLIIPILLLCFLNPFVFLLPASSGERISYTITVFLSLAVYMTLIGDNLPKVSDNMAWMSYFLLITLIYSSALIILTIFTLRCETVSDVNKFPSCLKRLTFCFCKQRKNRVSEIRLPDVNKKEETERNKTDDIDKDIQKDDVMRLIDMSLFVTSLSVLLIVIIWFFSLIFT